MTARGGDRPSPTCVDGDASSPNIGHLSGCEWSDSRDHSRPRGLNRTFRTTGASGPRLGSINFRPRGGTTIVSEPAWKAASRAHWDEKVAVHLGLCGYNLTSLRAGRGRFNAIEEEELGPVEGRHILHLQCHFGADSLKLVQRGATAVGLDFSAAAIEAARQLASELGLADRARFVQADLYDAPAAIPGAAAFDMVFVTWGAITWLPDIRRWAGIVCHFLKPGGSLYLAEAHPTAIVLDDAAPLPDGRPGLFAPYFSPCPALVDRTPE